MKKKTLYLKLLKIIYTDELLTYSDFIPTDY